MIENLDGPHSVEEAAAAVAVAAVTADVVDVDAAFVGAFQEFPSFFEYVLV